MTIIAADASRLDAFGQIIFVGSAGVTIDGTTYEHVRVDITGADDRKVELNLTPDDALALSETLHEKAKEAGHA